MTTSYFATLFSKLSFAQQTTSADDTGAASIVFFIFCCMFLFIIIVNILTIVGMYKIFEKAGQPGWTAIVPYLNSVIIAHIAGRDWWWGIIPILNIVPLFELAKKFGKSDGYGVGLVLLSPVFLPMLGFSKDQLVDPPRKPLF